MDVLINPILQEVADGFAAEAKSRWVLSEEQIREKIAKSKLQDGQENPVGASVNVENSGEENFQNLVSQLKDGSLKLPAEGVDAKLIKDLESQIDADQPNLPKDLRDKLITLTYHQTKYFEEHPGENKPENVELANAGVIAQGIRLAPQVLKHAEKALKIAKDFVLFNKIAGKTVEVQSEAQKSGGGGGQLDPDNGDDDGEGQESKPKKLTQKQKDQIEGIKLEGENPGNVHQPNGEPLKVDTELPGGTPAARELFERLTGKKLPEILEKRVEELLSDGRKIQIRPCGKSGHPKIEITDQVQNLLEKITFKK